MSRALSRVVRGAGHVLRRAAKIVSTVLIGLDGRRLPPESTCPPPKQYRP